MQVFLFVAVENWATGGANTLLFPLEILNGNHSVNRKGGKHQQSNSSLGISNTCS